ncbi:hypothetical protein D8674_017642 [Pyrus ussuriensis x Pyrus communis]|uniref:Uncharacterized protein n=1 Tax=Pyrus ussuriensis x Pyrus communis TaxID=2448454 RepID=A0A5N5HIN2_9ROSA|nr:hypothetical protein D8674_017642 [Pyrus ussuriensis x Pyrus communis]
MAVSNKKLIFKDKKSNEPNYQPCAKAIARNEASKGHRPENVISEKQSVVHKETLNPTAIDLQGASRKELLARRFGSLSTEKDEASLTSYRNRNVQS